VTMIRYDVVNFACLNRDDAGQVRDAVQNAAIHHGLNISQVTTLVTKIGSIHWHIRKEEEARGVLEVTYWPKKQQLWVEIHSNRQQLWNVCVIEPFAEHMAGALKGHCVKP
jgi:hypothetical protein